MADNAHWMAYRRVLKVCQKLGVSLDIPDEDLLDLAEEKLDVWERNELEGDLAELRLCEVLPWMRE